MGLEKADRPYAAQSSRTDSSAWISTGLGNQTISELRWPIIGVVGVESPARARHLSLAAPRPLLARFGFCRHLGSAALAAWSRIRENPTGETSGHDVTSGDVTGPPGSAGVPTKADSLELRGMLVQAWKSSGGAARLTATCVCPAGPSSP